MREDIAIYRMLALLVIAVIASLSFVVLVDIRSALRSIDNDLQIIAKQEAA